MTDRLITENDVESVRNTLMKKAANYAEQERTAIEKAARWAQELHKDQKRASGEPYIIHPFSVAAHLIDLNMDPDCVIAGLLHDVLEDTDITRQEMRQLWGREVELLVNGVTKISDVNVKSKKVQEAETIRKMFFAMVKDIRVILIKLADKYHNMQTLEFKSVEKQKSTAQECLDIYAPLAGKLGMYWLRSELEDLSLKYLHPEIFETIRKYVAKKRTEREEYLLGIQKRILKATSKNGILDIKVMTRAKHFYSIYNKMKDKGKILDDIYDFLGIRILCHNTTECYTIMGIIHQLWKPISGRFKDYIAMPKENNYKSLHTTILGDRGNRIEIQLRTYEMDRIAEYGVAAHWLYKENRTEGDVSHGELSVMNKLKSWNGKKINHEDFLSSIKKDLLQDSIYVFTPGGDTVELPQGSTAIDFAYHIHTDIGEHCIGAQADGMIIPLYKPLENSQAIKIMTSVNAHPKLDWLKHVKTARARQKIRYWLNKHDENLIIDRNIVARKENLKTPEPDVKHQERESAETEVLPEQEIHNTVLDKTKVNIRIGDERNMMIRIAKCCQPSTGDRIIGYISRGRGIIVHKFDCHNLRSIPDFTERKIEVEWETVSSKAVRSYKIKARVTTDLFAEIEGAIKKYSGHLISGNLNQDENDRLSGFFVVELDNPGNFKKVAKSIRTIPSVLNLQQIEDGTIS